MAALQLLLETIAVEVSRLETIVRTLFAASVLRAMLQSFDHLRLCSCSILYPSIAMRTEIVGSREQLAEELLHLSVQSEKY